MCQNFHLLLFSISTILEKTRSQIFCRQLASFPSRATETKESLVDRMKIVKALLFQNPKTLMPQNFKFWSENFKFLFRIPFTKLNLKFCK